MAAQEAQLTELTQLKAKALKAYSQKDYSASTELYASACELQSTLQGENNPLNAHLLYLYGRSLFEVALKKSDVLGDVTQEDRKQNEEKKRKSKDNVAANGAETAIGDKALEKGMKAGLFSFTGDENWDDSDGEFEDEVEGEGEVEGEKEEDDDDFTLAWEILDYARVLFLKQLTPDTSGVNACLTSDIPPTDSTATPITSILNLEAESTEENKVEEEGGEAKTKEKTGEKIEEKIEEEKKIPKPYTTKAAVLPEDIKALHTALADTYDLLGEVSLESESFVQAARDLRSSLDLKLQLYPIDSTLISEAHYKLSLALEFAAAGEDVSEGDRLKGREEAAVEMEKAIASCSARIEKEEEAVAKSDDKGKGKEQVTKSLTDAKEMVEELETRLADLRTAPSSLNEAAMDPLKGILGQVLGEDQAAAKKRIEEAMSGARDLTGLVRKKHPATATTTSSSSSTVPVAVGTGKPTESSGGKRKLDDLQEEEEAPLEESKKAKVSDSEEVQ